jgi:hypothetical protein
MSAKELSVPDAFARLRAMLEDEPETVQVEGDPRLVRPLLTRMVSLAKGRGFLAGSVALQNAGSAERGSVDVDGLFRTWASQGTDNAKLRDGLTAHRARTPGVRALMVIDALDYHGTSHITDVKNRVRALNNELDLLRLWIMLACDVKAGGGEAASDLATGYFVVAEP